MVWETLAAAVLPWLGEWITVTIAQEILGKAASQLRKQDVDRAFKVAVSAAEENCKQLFWRCEPHDRRKFLAAFFQGIVIDELQKPLQDKGLPDIEVLVSKFKQDAGQYGSVKDGTDCTVIKAWLGVFVNTFVANTQTYLRFQVAKEDYFKQLLIRFDKVEFAGMDVNRREEDNRATIKDIF